jgi:hypothetical protein
MISKRRATAQAGVSSSCTNPIRKLGRSRWNSGLVTKIDRS